MAKKAEKKEVPRKIKFAPRPSRQLILNEETVYDLAKTMLPVESIATLLGCSKDHIYSSYGDILRKGREGRKQSLSMAMWEKGLIDKDTKMLIWLSKQHLGYRDSAPETGTTINFNITVDPIPKKITTIEVAK